MHGLLPNELGDATGAMNTAFSFLALVGVITTLSLQMRELGLQRKAMRAQEEDLEARNEIAREENRLLCEQLRLAKLKRIEGLPNFKCRRPSPDRLLIEGSGQGARRIYVVLSSPAKSGTGKDLLWWYSETWKPLTVDLPDGLLLDSPKINIFMTASDETEWSTSSYLEKQSLAWVICGWTELHLPADFYDRRPDHLAPYHEVRWAEEMAEAVHRSRVQTGELNGIVHDWRAPHHRFRYFTPTEAKQAVRALDSMKDAPCPACQDGHVALITSDHGTILLCNNCESWSPRW